MHRQDTKRRIDWQDIFVGIDVHKKNWTVTVRTELGEFKTFSQDPDPDVLFHYLRRNFPTGRYHVVYEAGFSGFWAYDRFVELGMKAAVVHPPDIPTTDKERMAKADRVDSRKLCRDFQAGLLEPIYVPDVRRRQDRELIVCRLATVKKQGRVKNQIRSLLDRHGVVLPKRFRSPNHWSHNFMEWLREHAFSPSWAQQALFQYLDELEFLRARIVDLTQRVRKLGQEEPYAEAFVHVVRLPGVGSLSASTWIVLLWPIERFRNGDHLCSYVGLVPSLHQSGEKERRGALTRRKHKILFRLALENAWCAVRTDPFFNDLFRHRARRMPKNKAIIGVAKRLVLRLRHVWMASEPYAPGVVG